MNATRAKCGHPVIAVGAPHSPARIAVESAHCDDCNATRELHTALAVRWNAGESIPFASDGFKPAYQTGKCVCPVCARLTLTDRVAAVVDDYPQWSLAERRRLPEITEEILTHCRDGSGNAFIREWCNRVLVPALRPLFS